VCDGHKDCGTGDNSDEENCNITTTTKTTTYIPTTTPYNHDDICAPSQLGLTNFTIPTSYIHLSSTNDLGAFLSTDSIRLGNVQIWSPNKADFEPTVTVTFKCN